MISLADAAQAGGTIVTPALFTPSGGSLNCSVVNATSNKTVRVSSEIFDFNGNSLVGGSVITYPPHGSSVSLVSTNANARHCVVTLVQG
jgi:hypothetical protein